MRVLITGASSVLACKLVALLLEREKISIRLLEYRSPARMESCETVSGDMDDPESLNRACQGVDEVLHLAALTHSSNDSEYFKVNREGTQNLIDACKKNNVRRFIFISSMAAKKNGGAYGLSKLASEALVIESGLQWVILRPAEVYGPKMNEGIGQLITWVKKFKIIPVIGDGSYSLSPVYIDDVVEAMARVMNNPDLINQKFDLCGPELIPFRTLIDRLARYLGVRRNKIFIPVWVAKLGVLLASLMKVGSFTPDQIPRLICGKDRDATQNTILTSYSPRKFEDGLREYL